MEYTQWDIKEMANWASTSCLNPCCNGIYSMSIKDEQGDIFFVSLNPCCNGIYSMRKIDYGKEI